MTKNTGKGKKKRDKQKYPNLKKNLNIKARRDYIDTFYVDGITDSKGNEIMRALNEEEKQWLDDFYAGHVNASFVEKNSAFELLEEEDRVALRQEIKTLKKASEELQRRINELVIECNELQEQREVINAQIEELSLQDQKKRSYDANNARNRCLYNQAKKTGKLIKLNYKDYDDRTVKMLQGLDLEHVFLNEDDYED
jgi:predicted RNase H-like nuclease (RuvC/YqgF family)